MSQKRDSLSWRAIAGCLLLLGASTLAQGETRAVIVGMTTPLTGPNAAYGQGLLQGVRLGLAHSLPSSVELKVLDDGGDPVRASANARALIDAGAVALTGVQGSRSAEALRSLAAKTGVPLVGLASSADSLRNPPQREVFNLRAGVSDEVDAMVLQLDTLMVDRIAALAEDDALGSSGVDGLMFQLLRLAMRPTAIESLPAGASVPAVTAAMRRICASDPQAILLAVQPQLAIAAMTAGTAAGCATTQFVAFSETGMALATEGALRHRLMVSQVLPKPSQIGHPLVAAYRRALGPQVQQASYPSLEGYLYGRVLGEVLRLCGKRTTAACIVETLEARPLELDGWRLYFSRSDHRGSRFVDLTLLDQSGRITR